MGIICKNPQNSSQVIWESKSSVGIAVFPFILELVAVLVGVIAILNKYTSIRKQPIFYYVSIVIGWYLALAILVLMPTDISMVRDELIFETDCVDRGTEEAKECSGFVARKTNFLLSP